MNTPLIDEIKKAALDAQEKVKPLSVEIPKYNIKTRKMEKHKRIIRSGKEGNSAKRIVVIAAFILAEIAALAFLYTQFVLAFLWALFVPYGIAIIFAFRVFVSKKNYDSKIAWIMFLLILAPAAVFVYLLAGESSVTPIKARRLKRISAATKFLKKIDTKDLPPRVRQDCNYIQNTSDFVPFFGGKAEYFPTGEQFFEDVLTRLASAEKFIFLDFFIVDKGFLSQALFKILIEKAKKGVDVRIIVDGLGSHGTLSIDKVSRIRRHGIKIIAFQPVVPIIDFFINYRNHRKIIVIDGKTGYVGGANIADEYINAKGRLGVWKDASLRMDGQAINSLTLMFLRMWEYSCKKTPDYKKFLDQVEQSEQVEATGEAGIILPFAEGVAEPHRLGKGVYENIISGAKETLFIMSPYFVVDSDIIKMLRAKAQSGVDVRLLIPEIPDKKIVYMLTKANAQSLLSSGARVYTYSLGFLHSKVMLSDNECAVVGSINMDFRSFYQQYESAAYLTTPSVIQSIAADFENTFAVSKELTLENIKKRTLLTRITHALLRLFAPLM